MINGKPLSLLIEQYEHWFAIVLFFKLKVSTSNFIFLFKFPSTVTISVAVQFTTILAVNLSKALKIGLT